MLDSKTNNFKCKSNKLTSLMVFFCIVALTSCDDESAHNDCGNFLPRGKDAHLFLRNFSCENSEAGITRFRFSGRLGFSSLNAVESNDGSQSIRISSSPPERKNINILVIDQIDNPNLEISIAQCQKPWSSTPDEAGNPTGRRCTLREFAQQEKDALFIINGGHFHYSYTHYQPPWDRLTQDYEIGDSAGLLKINNNTLAEHPYLQEPFRKNWGILSLRQAGDLPTIGALDSSVDNVLLNNPHVISAAPLLITGCVAVPMNKLYRETMTRWPSAKESPGMLNHVKAKIARTAIGTDTQGRLYIFNVDGNIANVSSGMNLEEVTSMMASLGLCNAMGLEGGSSAGIFDVRNNTYLNEGPKYLEFPIGTALIIKKRNPSFKIRQVLNEFLISRGARPHTDYRIIHPLSIDNYLDSTGDIPLSFLGSQYIDENKKYYFSTEDQRKIYRMKIENGLIINPNDNKPASGLGKYVFSRNHEFFVAFLKKNETYPTVVVGKNENRSLANPGDAITRLENFDAREIRHSYFTAGESVIVGGWTELQNGKIKCIDNHSGHYLPGSSTIDYLLRTLIFDYNIDINDANIYSYKNPEAMRYSRCWEMKLPRS